MPEGKKCSMRIAIVDDEKQWRKMALRELHRYYGDSKAVIDMFASVVLPDKCDNITFAKTKDKGKTTNRSYGQIKMSSYKNCSKVDCWMRTYVNQTWHYWTPYILSNVSDKSKHKIKYCDQKSSYYKSGVTAQLRGENADSRIAIFGDSKVSGEVWFN